MKRLLALGAALAAACSSAKKEKPIVYEAPLTPTTSEQTAIADAEATLEGSLAFVAPTKPDTGGPGLADQLVAALGGYAVSSRAPDASSAKLARTAVRQALDTGGMDPACVTTEQANGVTTVRWGQAAPCTVSSSDPTTSMTVGVEGWLAWNATTGVTTWDIGETVEMWTTSGDPFSMSGTAVLHGTMTVSADRIAIEAESDADVTTAITGMTIEENVKTTLEGTVGYQDQAQGWRFDWSGCDAFTVAHGS